MKRFLVLLLVALFAIGLTVGCGKKEAAEADKVPADVKEAEMADTTRMDEGVVDSLAGEVKEAAEEVVDEAAEAVEGAVKDATGGN